MKTAAPGFPGLETRTWCLVLARSRGWRLLIQCVGGVFSHARSRLAAVKCRIGLPPRMISRSRSGRNRTTLRRFGTFNWSEEPRVNHEAQSSQQHESPESGKVFYEVPEPPTQARRRITENSKKRAEHDAAPEQNEAKAHILAAIVLALPAGSLPLGMQRKISDRRAARWSLGWVRQARTTAAAELLIG